MKTILTSAMIAATLSMFSPAMAQDNLPAATRLAMPGENHAMLEPIIGRWDVEMRVYPGPGAEPIVSNEMSATREWVLGRRYVQEALSGSFASNPSERLMIIGYNNLEERFELASFDTFEPGFMVYDGQADGTTISVEGVSLEAGFGPTPTGRHRDLRFELTIENERSVQRIFVKFPTEDEFLFVEQIFTPAQ
ncbi:MAG: DUF1579 family protein [Pseudomonadota bacterium]